MNNVFQKILSSIDTNKDWVICISHSTKKDFCKLTGMPEERVFVTHLGASNNFYKESNTDKIQATLNKYKIPQGRYILGLSTLEPRKNTAHLIRCFFKILSESNYDDVYLVLAGSKGWLYEEVFETADSNSNLKDKIIFTGFIYADFNYANWNEGIRGLIVITSFFIAFFNYVWDTSTPTS